MAAKGGKKGKGKGEKGKGDKGKGEKGKGDDVLGWEYPLSLYFPFLSGISQLDVAGRV